MNEINKFYKSLMQDIAATQTSDEDGGSQEQTFTRIAIEMLADGGETENVAIVYDEKDFGKKRQHKINGYAISDNYDTIRTVAKTDI